MAKKPVLYFLLSLGVILVFFLTSFNLTSYLTKPREVVLGETVDLTEEKNFWQTFVNQHSTYQDGWKELARIEKELGNTGGAQKALEKVLEINPNSF